jgi:hypothetical protein
MQSNLENFNRTGLDLMKNPKITIFLSALNQLMRFLLGMKDLSKILLVLFQLRIQGRHRINLTMRPSLNMETNMY